MVGNRIWILDDAHCQSDGMDPENVAIFDDFIARGATLSRDARAIRDSNMEIDNIYGIALGKNERRGYGLPASSNNHVPEECTDLRDECARGN